VYEESDEALKDKLSALTFRGLDSDLRLTENAQPSILTHSIAVWTILQRELGWENAPDACRIALGHSLGEFTALCIAGAMEFADAVRLVVCNFLRSNICD
jgi:[acyl-carrier-protein] S-malonyltransferase